MIMTMVKKKKKSSLFLQLFNQKLFVQNFIEKVTMSST